MHTSYPKSLNDWNSSVIKRLLEAGSIEDDNLEYKSEQTAKMMNTVSGFLNTEGGFLVIGIKEDEVTGKLALVGVTKDTSSLKDQFVQFASGRMSDGKFRFDLKMVETKSKKLVLIYHIPRDNFKIYQSEFKYYRRMNGSNSPMNDYEVDLNKKIRNPKIQRRSLLIGQLKMISNWMDDHLSVKPYYGVPPIILPMFDEDTLNTLILELIEDLDQQISEPLKKIYPLLMEFRLRYDIMKSAIAGGRSQIVDEAASEYNYSVTKIEVEVSNLINQILINLMSN